jgi:hypothetical protein
MPMRGSGSIHGGQTNLLQEEFYMSKKIIKPQQSEKTGFKIPKQFDSKERAKILRVIDRGIKAQTPAREIKQKLRDKGLGYRDTNLYHDIRRRKAEYRPLMTTDRKIAGYYKLDKEARVKSVKWYDKVFEAYRKERKLTAKQVNKIWDRAREQSYSKLSDADIEEAEDIWEYYSDAFGSQ